MNFSLFPKLPFGSHDLPGGYSFMPLTSSPALAGEEVNSILLDFVSTICYEQ